MVHQDGRVADQPRQQAGGLADVFPAELEVAEAAVLQGGEVRAVGGEEGVQRHGEDVDDGGSGLALPVEGGHGGEDGGGVFEVGDVLWGEEGAEGDDVVEGDGHAAAGQRVAHVHCVAEEDEAGGFLGRRGQERVGHGAQLAGFDGADEAGAHAGGEVGDDDVEEVVLHAAGFDGGAGEALGDVDEDARLVGADLVDEDGGRVGEDDVAVVGHGEDGVDEFEAVEFAADLRGVGEVRLAELGGVAVSDEGDGAEVVILCAGRLAFDAQDLARMAVLDHVGDGGFDDGDIGGGGGGGAQLGDELAVVEGATFWLLGGFLGEQVVWVGDVDGLVVVRDLVAVAGDGVDALEAVYLNISTHTLSLLYTEWIRRTLHAQLLQRIHSAGLQQLAHDPIRLLPALLEQNDAAALLAKRHGRRAPHDARAHNHNVRLVVHAPPLLAHILRVRPRRRHLVDRRAAGAQRRCPVDPRRQRHDLVREHGEHRHGWREVVGLLKDPVICTARRVL